MVAIGARTEVAGLALAGVTVLVAERPEEAVAAWEALPEGTALVLVGRAAARELGPARLDVTGPLTAVLP
ncbi:MULTISPECIES: hypothetical protein [Kitasatospora]|uniref:Uncharacterized protein n=1 Tax=Kitasatospora cathayae TaxID=3004092 RepID=A0ABY7PWU1_9ACTN|nr:hypothetical protein [Kitasatospora sp. HUAS 3-15]WBP84637.1 hypothetical protein O1G21_01405 [Kitasatospora sp. HUAS 3-15]